MEQFLQQIDFILRLVVALFFGILIGAERNFALKSAGMRTYGLVSMGSAIFVAGSLLIMHEFPEMRGLDPLRMASQVVVGIGFLGGGLIFVKNGDVNNLTTAAGLWVVAGIGMLSGFGLYIFAGIATALTLLVFTALWHFEQKIKIVGENMRNRKRTELSQIPAVGGNENDAGE
jgi:putative Mg2+ transporter-C (MgtC) family protein